MLCDVMDEDDYNEEINFFPAWYSCNESPVNYEDISRLYVDYAGFEISANTSLIQLILRLSLVIGYSRINNYLFHVHYSTCHVQT